MPERSPQLRFVDRIRNSTLQHLAIKNHGKRKVSKYKTTNYAIVLATKDSFMDKSDLGIADASKSFCRTLLEEKQMVPQDSLFSDNLFDKIAERYKIGTGQ